MKCMYLRGEEKEARKRSERKVKDRSVMMKVTNLLFLFDNTE